MAEQVHVRLMAAAGAERVRAEQEAAEAVGRGELIAAAGDVEYLLIGAAGSFGAERLGESAWLLPDVHAADEAFGGMIAPVQRRVIHRLAPGPAVFAIELGEDEAAKVRAKAGLPERFGQVGSGTPRLRVRVLGASSAATVVQRNSGKGPALGVGLRDAEGRAARDAGDAMAAAQRAGATIALDSGATARAGEPTEIVLSRAGGVSVEREGAYERRYVLNQATLNILFVCTGNTCRSPMAEAIARGLLEKDKHEHAVKISSAGLGAGSGAPATAEAIRAVKGLGYKDALAKHASHPLTRQRIEEADAILVMTRSHLAGVLAISPDAQEKTMLVDPSGEDVPDPIGLPAKVYTETARRLEKLIAQRLKELTP